MILSAQVIGTSGPVVVQLLNLRFGGQRKEGLDTSREKKVKEINRKNS
jgi:hypothetical protein